MSRQALAIPATIAAAIAVTAATVSCWQTEADYSIAVAANTAYEGVDINDCVEGPIVLPANYVSRLVVQPPLAGLGRVVRSESGVVYFEHAGVGEGRRVSRLDVVGNASTTVLEVPPWATPMTLVGGPGDSFFAAFGSQIRQVQPDGSSTLWGPDIGPMPWAYTPDGRLLAIGAGGTSVVELAPDGSFTTLLAGLMTVYDIAAAADGDIYVVDFLAGQLIELAPDGSTRVLTAIAPDNTDLALDADDNLYLNNAAAGFARVDRISGAVTALHASGAPCHVVQSPADLVFDADGRTIFASWVESRLTWADVVNGNGNELLHAPWANNTSATLGADDAVYVGVAGCGTAIPGEIARLTAGGTSEIYLAGFTDTIRSLDFDDAGDLFIATSAETGVGIHHYDPASGALSLVPDSDVYDVDSIAYDPLQGRILAASVAMTTNQATVRGYDSAGLQGTDTVSVPKTLMALLLDLGPDGTLFGFGVERDRFFSGPVDHFLMDLDLAAGTSQVVFKHTRQGCCPASNFSVDAQGHAWVVLNPDFLLYDVAPDGYATLFACSLPIDSLGAFRTSQNDILLNSPAGMYRIWQPTLAESVELVRDELSLLAYYDVLEAGRYNGLAAKLNAAIAALERGRTNAAANQLEAFLRQVDAFVRTGRLPEARADDLIADVQAVLDRL